MMVVHNVDDDVKRRANSLADTLLRRFKHHVSTRVLVESKRSHPILKWYRRNIPFFAAYMVLFNHVKSNTSNLSDMECLLTNSMHNFLILNSNTANLEGGYVVWDCVLEKWIRSGKCNNRGMVVRWNDHFTNAKSAANSNGSKFGELYPSKHNSTRYRDDGRCFEDLKQYAAVAFEPSDDAYDLFQKDFDDGGLFCWTPAEKELVCSTNIRGCKSDGAKFGTTVSYGFELLYDLAISRRDNVSKSPVFESFGFMHGG